MHLSEDYQTEAALTDRLAKLAQAEVIQTPGTLEFEFVVDAIRHTAAALTRLQLRLYGPPASADTEAASEEWAFVLTIPENELRALHGDR